MVSQFLVLNNRVQEEAAQRIGRSTGGSSARSPSSIGVLLLVVGITGVWVIRANRRAFDAGRAAVGASCATCRGG